MFNIILRGDFNVKFLEWSGKLDKLLNMLATYNIVYTIQTNTSVINNHMSDVLEIKIGKHKEQFEIFLLENTQ